MLTAVQHQDKAAKYLRRFVEGNLVSSTLLVGNEGVGRKFSVLHAVQEVFCSENKTPDCSCYSCSAVLRGAHPDLTVLQAGDSTIGVDAIREITERSKAYPSSAPVRCFLIDGADRLTVPAANAFLKTLEEPPTLSRFFLLAEVYDQVLPTIRSRCGCIHYSALPEAFIVSVLHQYAGDDAKALVYARMGEGSVGNAVQYWGSGRLGLRDQILKVVQLSLDRDLPAFFAAVDAIDQDLPLALKFLEQVLHDVFMVRVDPMRIINVDRTDDIRSMSARAPVKVWASLANKVRALRTQQRTTYIYVPFHLKTVLAESFV